MIDDMRTTPQQHVPPTLVLAGRWLLLVPEALALAVLLLVYVATGQSTVVALLIIGVAMFFSVRIAALYLARSAFEQARAGEAEILAGLAATMQPLSADALALRGALASARQDPETAEHLIRKAIDLLPGQPAYHGALSSVLLDLGRPVEAAVAARTMLALDPNSALGHLYLAEASHELGSSAQAIETYLRNGTELARNPAEQAALQCALIGHLFEQQRFAEASLLIHSVEALLTTCPQIRQAELRFQIATLLAAHGQHERARTFYQDIEELDPHGRYTPAAWRAARS